MKPIEGGNRYRESITTAVSSEALLEETKSLPIEQVLAVSDPFAVFYADAQQIPNTLQEIGRLREITFRLANEGTGRATDLDVFDLHYVHLFLWNTERNEVVGAYRLGKTDEIVSNLGDRGLYTTTLFDYHGQFLDRISPALELGRSFVRPVYQKTFPPLFLLWKGIAQYVARYPQYRTLFGPVSIGSDYQPIARELIVECLSERGYRHELADLVQPKTPFLTGTTKGCSLRAESRVLTDIGEVSALISDLEEDRKGIPVMLKQYLKLGGKLLGFNVDPAFSDVLDGLVLVDLTQSDTRLIARLMGEDAARDFLEYHRPRYLLAS